VSDGIAPGVTVPVVCLDKNEIAQGKSFFTEKNLDWRNFVLQFPSKILPR
jgi:hypothetical protein